MTKKKEQRLSHRAKENIRKMKFLRKYGIKISVKEVPPSKIPEAVEKTAETSLRENIIAQTADAMLDALNAKIEKDDLTFEEALHATDILHLSIIAKYINFMIDVKLNELLGSQEAKDRRMYA